MKFSTVCTRFAAALLVAITVALIGCHGGDGGGPISTSTGHAFIVEGINFYHEDVYLDVWFDGHYYPGPLVPAYSGPTLTDADIGTGPYKDIPSIGTAAFGIFSGKVYEIYGYMPAEVKVGGHSGFDGKILPIVTYRYGQHYNITTSLIQVGLVPQKPEPIAPPSPIGPLK